MNDSRTVNGFYLGDRVEYTAYEANGLRDPIVEIRESTIEEIRQRNCSFFNEFGIVNCDIVQLADGYIIFDAKLTRIGYS